MLLFRYPRMRCMCYPYSYYPYPYSMGSVWFLRIQPRSIKPTLSGDSGLGSPSALPYIACQMGSAQICHIMRTALGDWDYVVNTISAGLVADTAYAIIPSQYP